MISIDLNKDPELTKPRKQTPCVSQYPTVTAVKNKQGDLLPMITPAVFMGFMIYYKINVERFAGLNICGFSRIKFFVEILLQCIGHQCLLFTYS